MNKNILFLAVLQFILVSLAFSQKVDLHFEKINKAFMQSNSSTVLVAAHRGGHLEAPENSMAAFRKAIELGIDIIELDVRCTKDGKLILMHDRTVDRTTNGSGQVDSFTFEEIRKLKLKHNGKLTDERIPTLEEALNLAKGKILVDLDIKTSACINEIMATVERTKTEHNCFFFLGAPQYVTIIKAKNPAFRTLLRTHRATQVDSAMAIVKTEAVHIDPSHYTTEVVKTIKTNNARIWINALGDVDRKAAGGDLAAFEEVLKFGANMIQTDQPALLKEYLIKTKRYY